MQKKQKKKKSKKETEEIWSDVNNNKIEDNLNQSKIVELDELLDDNKNEEIKQRRTAVKHGLLSLIIGILASLDLKLVPFWLVFITSYYLNLG